ncbi:hypothetical protein CR513_19122, partial [Mucuna pruriens]
MDFVLGFPGIEKNMNFIWVILDRLTKFAHFIPIKIMYSVEKLKLASRIYKGATYNTLSVTYQFSKKDVEHELEE